MPLQNRSRPDGSIVRENWRGDLMGNRGGRIHDPNSKTLLKRRWASKRWILCVLKFKQRQREVMGKSYTEVFFLDEVSGLASGHRPCFECQRPVAKLFAQCWQTAFGNFTGSEADTMDKVLHEQRLASPIKIEFSQLDRLPVGAFVAQKNNMLAKHDKGWLKWSGTGYSQAEPEQNGTVLLLTPPAILDVLRAGYQPAWHKSASEV